MITRTLATLLTVILALASAAGATGEARHSGTIVGLREQPAQIVMEEIGPWTGPDGGLVRRTIALTPETSIQEVRRTDAWDDSRTSKPGFDERAIDASALRIGDFVTVTVRDAEPAVAIAMEVVRAQGDVGQPSASGPEPARLTTTETLVGTWSGRWQPVDGAPGGSLGLVLTRVPGRETVVGQFTFISGALTRTMRYEGRLENGAVRFTLVGDGHIVLEPAVDAQRPMTADRLSGTWIEQRGALPAARGSLELQRAAS